LYQNFGVPPEHVSCSSFSGKSEVLDLACSPRMSGIALRRPVRPVVRKSVMAFSVVMGLTAPLRSPLVFVFADSILKRTTEIGT
jgi:hypothetical protein